MYSNDKYIWRTVEDDKVRSSHRQYNGKIFSWDNPPQGGHPGEDYNCRCWAEPVRSETATGLNQEVISNIYSSGTKWNWYDFLKYAYTGDGIGVDLQEIGLLSDIVNHAKETIFYKVERQVEELAQSTKDGGIQDTFSNSYSFKSVSYSLGDSTINGVISGNVHQKNNLLYVNVIVKYYFSDEFTDPSSIREAYMRSSNSENADYFTEFGMDAYSIKGNWETKITGTIEAKE